MLSYKIKHDLFWCFWLTFRILRGIVPLQIKVIYNTIDLLDIQKLDTTFKLIQYVNETAFYELMTTSQELLHNLSLAKASLEKFRKSSNFGKTIYSMLYKFLSLRFKLNWFKSFLSIEVVWLVDIHSKYNNICKY